MNKIISLVVAVMFALSFGSAFAEVKSAPTKTVETVKKDKKKTTTKKTSSETKKVETKK